jgi:lysophospholipase L1-like esterase
LGANDATLFGAQHVPLDEYSSKLGQILDLLPASVPKVLITPPIPQGEVWAASKGIAGLEPNRSEANTARYAQACREVARGRATCGVELVDLWQAMDDYRSVEGQQLGDLLTDGLHLSERVRPWLLAFAFCATAVGAFDSS